MPFDPGMADQMRDDLADLGADEGGGLTERRMFGGLCFQLAGHMVCGVHKAGAMFRVGKPAEPRARDLGAAPLSFTGRPMGGMVELDEAGFADDALRRALIELSLDHARSLPPKEQL